MSRASCAAASPGGFEFPLLIGLLQQLMCSHNPSLEDFSWSDVVNTEVQSRLQQVTSTHAGTHAGGHARAQ